MVTLIVLKIGGSLFDSSKTLLRRVAEEGLDILVVPGGGAFADVVRDVYGKCDLSDDAAHWMALLAMDQYGYYMSDGTGVPLSGKIGGKGTRSRPGLRDFTERRCAAPFLGCYVRYHSRLDGVEVGREAD